MSDRLTLTRAFEGAGIKSDEAERIATEIYNAIHDNVATKADVATAVADLRTEIASVRAELLKWMFGQTVVILGAVFAMLHFVK
jgi:hypothetical protein